ncbi:hypothetical protein PRZ48_003926 [Zasmidium cellare]|uniref:DNA mismatch repair protein MutL n=1 Tax=Zasmidium cellare TaxID=395010 RepID=A0ABR0EXS2_ZASCE|nr:hypothetical protein PRZ48_003926 [Zasmidium cellare]
MATIKAIEDRSVHQIQSGQVIVDLQSVVKELVENSLDAGATSIEVRLKNHGLDAIEVQDNGKGISPEDFETIALKHYTSKLSSYDDLNSLDTFGFRGEALSSLCALSNFHITTAREQDGAVGKKLDFELSGKLKSASVSAAPRGTTIFVENIFHNLPVRRKELEKNIKREYGKALGLLYQYACVSVGVRFSVSNQMPKGKKVVAFSTKSNTTTKENITNVFGAKTLLALTKLDLYLEMAPSVGPSTQSARNWSTQATNRSLEVHVQGHISKPIFGEGRQAPDRQMFFVNSRPCQLPQVSKAINEVYKSFNVSQTPFIFANFVMDTNAYDVNVSPDKRTILLHDQTALLESLKNALTELFEQTDHTVPQSTLPNRKLPSYQPLKITRRESTTASESPDVQEHDEEGALESDADSDSETDLPAAQPVGSPANLIHSWADRDLQPRSEKQFAKMQNGALSKDKQKLLKKLQETPPVPAEPVNGLEDSENNIQDGDEEMLEVNGGTARPVTNVAEPTHQPIPRVDAVHNPDPMSTPYDDLFSQRPPEVPRQAQDFNAQLERVRGNNPDVSQDDEDEQSAEAGVLEGPAQEQPIPRQATQNAPAKDEVPIPVITPGTQKSAPGPIQNAFDRMRPKRTPLQTAEITVGDETTTTVIGNSPPYKKRRIHKPDDSQAVARFGASPSLARGLRQKFAAPGSQLQLDSSALPPANPADDRSDNESVEEASEHSDVEEDRSPEEVPRMPKDTPDTSDSPTSDALDDLIPAPVNDDEWDEDYMDEEEKKMREDERVAALIQEAEEAAAKPTEENLKRAANALKNGGNRKNSTLQLVRFLDTSTAAIEKQLEYLNTHTRSCCHHENTAEKGGNAIVKGELDDSEAEARLSLTVTKADFERMRIIGQFNLGFILAVRPGKAPGDEDDLFIIDQHAADEKYNYERLQRTVTLQSQRLVRPKPLQLTAMQEEIIINHTDALKANGFEIEMTTDVTGSEDEEISHRQCRLLTLPMSKEKTFDLSDLEELLHLLSEQPAGSNEIPRPKKVQSMLAMRACRSSIMVGKNLTMKQMERVVRHMGEMEKPWNCPHGRPTMRHLAGLGEWRGWQEGNLVDEYDRDASRAGGERTTDWGEWLKKQPQ